MAVVTESENDVTVLQSDSDSVGMLESIFGAITVSFFIIIWLASAISPLILGFAVARGFYSVATAIVVVTVIAYLPGIGNGPIARRLRMFIDKHHPSYYDGVSIVFEGGEVPPAEHRQTFFAVHPHGAFCIGWAMLFTCPNMYKVRFCFAPALFISPFFRLFSRCVGKPGSAARPTMDSYLKAGEDVALPPGGFEEATLTSTTQDRVFIKKRYGFVRLCLKYGVAIRPVYAFGEGSLFNNVQGLWNTRLALNRFGIPTILVWGRWFSPLLPKKKQLHIVVGRTIVLPKIENPTKEEVSKWHNKYIAELRRIYDDHKENAYGPEKAKEIKLEVW